MQRSTMRTSALLSRIRGFLEMRRPEMHIGKLDLYIRELAELSAELQRHSTEHEALRRQQLAATGEIHKRVRVIRRQYLRAIELRMRQMLRKDNPLREALKLRKIPRKPSALIGFAGGAADALAPHTAALGLEGMADDFLERLQHEIELLKKAIDRREAIQARAMGSRVAVLDAALSGRRLVRHIDAMIWMHLEENAPEASEWRSLVRLGRWRSTHRAEEATDENSAMAESAQAPVEVAAQATMPVLVPTPARDDAVRGGEQTFSSDGRRAA